MFGEIESNNQFNLPNQEAGNPIHDFVATTWAPCSGRAGKSNETKATSDRDTLDFDEYPVYTQSAQELFRSQIPGDTGRLDAAALEVGADVLRRVGADLANSQSREVAHVDDGQFADMKGLLVGAINKKLVEYEKIEPKPPNVNLLDGEPGECIRALLEYRLKTAGFSEADKLGEGLRLRGEHSLNIRLDKSYEDAVIGQLKKQGTTLDHLYIRVAELKKGNDVVGAIGLVGVSTVGGTEAVPFPIKTPLKIYPVEYGPRLPLPKK